MVWLLVAAGFQWVEPRFENVIVTSPIVGVKRNNGRFPLWDQANTAKWERYEPMWDEFAGARLNPAKWLDHNPGWKGRQPGWFDPKNVRVQKGNLQLTARASETPPDLAKEGYHTFSTAAVQSVGTVLYGAFEIRAKPMNSAASSAFWFYKGDPDQWTEIDVFEIGGKAKGLEKADHMTVHVFRTPTISEHHQVGGAWNHVDNLANDYHVYGLEWSKEEIKWFFDGVLIRRGENKFWHQPLTMNFDSETMPDWFGLPNPADLPSTFSIDYVRSWQPKKVPSR